MSDSKGRFVWFDLFTTDPTAAAAFYTQVVGWSIENWGGAAAYPMWKTPGGRAIGGSEPLPEAAVAMAAPPHWLGYIATPDLEATLALAEAHGARVLRPAFDIPNVGRTAVLADPTGAVFSPFQSANPSAPEPVTGSKPGEVGWHELMSSDPAKALAFYGAVFGWVPAGAMDMGPMGTYQMFGLDEKVAMGGMMGLPPGAPSSSWLYYFNVADLDGCVAKATALGGSVAVPPMEIPGGGRIATLIDPQGAFFALHVGP